MIGFVRGKLVVKAPPHLTVDVGGVGYDIEAPMSTFYTLPAVGSEVRLLTHLTVREDAHILYGFGMRMNACCLATCSRCQARDRVSRWRFLRVERRGASRTRVKLKDAAALTKIPGVGRKTAERLLVEMPDRLDALSAAIAAGAPSPNAENRRRG